MNLLYAWVDLHKSNPKTNEWTFKTYKRPPFFNLNALNSLNFGLNIFSLSFYNQIKNHSFASAQLSSFSLISMHYIMILPIAMPSPWSPLQHRCIHNNQIQSCFEYKHQSIHSVACLTLDWVILILASIIFFLSFQLVILITIQLITLITS